MLYRIIVFKNKNNDTYYYKVLSGYYHHYYIGYQNQFNHEVILIIDFNNDPYKIEKIPLQKRMIEKIMYCLNRFKERW